ncbi:MAG: ABC transporter substrate-binding protein [Cellulosilyticaceae bacterium]
MKSKLMKQIIVLSLGISTVFTGCGQKVEIKGDGANATTLKIGISQLAEHPALDASREGFIEEMNSLGIDVQIDYQNAQGDVANTQLIAEKFVKDKKDLIFSIATMSSQSAKKAIEGTEVPLVFTAVTDPVHSQLVKGWEETEQVTGVSDVSPIDEQLVLFQEINESIETIGVIYNTGESNSEIQVEEAKKVAETLGLKLKAVGITVSSDIPQAMNTIAKECQGLYVITDNLVSSSIELVANLALEHQLVTVAADGTLVEKGMLMAKGINYFELGKQSAQMAQKILIEGVKVKDLPVEQSHTFEKSVNKKTVEALGLKLEDKAFEDAIVIE